MRLSEAIRLGAMMKPQGQFYHNAAMDSTCAMGAALDAVGALWEVPMAHAQGDQHVPARQRWPWAFEQIGCPVCGTTPKDRGVTSSTVAHIHNKHGWTREQIADWVETIEAAHDVSVAEPELAMTGLRMIQNDDGGA